jgi:hypothetical protein
MGRKQTCLRFAAISLALEPDGAPGASCWWHHHLHLGAHRVSGRVAVRGARAAAGPDAADWHLVGNF